MTRDENKKIFKGEYWDEKDVDKRVEEIKRGVKRR